MAIPFRKRSVCLAFGTLLGATTAPAFAANDAMLELIKVLRDQGTINQEAYELIRNAAMADEEKGRAAVQQEVATKVAAAPAPGGAAPAPAAAPAAPKPMTWADTITLKGDLRTRYDMTNREDSESRGRGRLRYRLGVIAAPMAGLEVGAGIASGAGDQRSTNQSFDDVFSGKQLNLDYAYMQYAFGNGITGIAGKFQPKNYLYTATDMMWDSDINPEGASLKYAIDNAFGPFAVQGGVWVLSENGGDDKDSYLGYVQVAQSWKDDVWFGTVAASTYVFSDLKSAVNAFHAGGNTDTQMNSFAFDAEVGTRLGPGAASIIGTVVDNYETRSAQDLGWSVGARYLWDRWNLKYVYVDLDANAVPDFLPDSDRFDGDTGITGHELELQYQLFKQVVVGVDYYHAKRDADNIDEDRVQADINVKF